MAIAYGSSVSTSGSGVGSLTTGTMSLSGSDLWLGALIADGDINGATPSLVVLCKWRGALGESLTQQGSNNTVTSADASTSIVRTSVWSLTAPSADGNQTLYVTFAGAGAHFISAVYATGADQTTPVRGTATGSGTDFDTGSSTGVTTVSGDLVFDIVAVLDDNGSMTNISQGSGTRVRHLEDTASLDPTRFFTAVCWKAATTTTTTLTETFDGASDSGYDFCWAQSLIAVKAAGGGGSTVTGSFNAAGAGSASGVLAVTNAQAFTSSGAGAVSAVGASTNAQAFTSSGAGSVSGVGASTVAGALTSAGAGSVSFVGSYTTSGEGAFSSAGAGSLSAVGASTNAATFSAVGAGAAIFVGTTVASDTITLTDLTSRRVFQRSGTSKSITITGTYTGSPTSIQARVVQDGTSTEVVTWTTIVASPSGGTFSGALSVPQGGWYNVQVRFGNSTGVTSNGSNKWGVGILGALIGQSIAHFAYALYADVTPNDLLSYYNDSASQWTAPTTGNGAITLGNNVITANSVPVGIICDGIDGASLRSDGDTGYGYWLNNAGGQIYQTFLALVAAVGGELEFILWAQGESDSISGNVTEAEYASASSGDPGLTYFITSRIRADIVNGSSQSALPFLISLQGENAFAPSDASVDAIRRAQVSVAGSVSETYIAATTADLDTDDGIHYTDASFTIVGARWAKTVNYILGKVSYYRGPYVSGISTVSATQTDVTIVHRGGTDFTPTSAITGFTITVNGSALTISAAARQSATVIRLTHTSTSGERIVSYLYGAVPDHSASVHDNTSESLPLELYRYEVAVSVAQSSTGGWGFLNAYQIEQHRRSALRRKRERLLAQAKEIEDRQDAVTRELAEYLRLQEIEDSRREELTRIRQLARQYQDEIDAQVHGERIARAFARAAAQGNYSALEALDRELSRMQEEEEFLMQSLMFVINQQGYHA